MVKVVLQPIGRVKSEVLLELKGLIQDVGIECEISEKSLKLPKEAYNRVRKQFNSSKLLSLLQSIFPRESGEEKIVGIVEEDIYAEGLNFVFGEAELSGKFAIVSLARLQDVNKNLFLERALKEIIHEVGYTLGLEHCKNPLCVMHFSNCLADTDRKNYRFCKSCSSRLWCDEKYF
ncbi:MAG: archaemetzincin family Zn-dependent metalloprotease [Candidatus Nanoarchaeia archaeon]|nr:archaemetzincin family Zn-dependent metalloprotease [Candidatus Haiyanarchaeum thermophilum]MCW1302843.1 archaemetzincin family Zn-dependent metalloprotease [Candidatus Haiyanarchaeum thermophilum]MCW1303523.1 archaemetzincin family Zn-dependent metalloprotease [Candidatus Haiyanarchaeum thermophilum]MCW1306703.1 archaemetzincin family Zn-dependent metalloprotease [Candidatus Haiyanarchaeum thermophilum]MCW1307341.1 archaemetzincin family Zn-dependent metalloprotease [Candidatus Haiyanarchae